MTAMTGRGRSRSTTCPQPGQVALYRFYDARETLLYVGISNDPRRRWKEHAQTKAWYPEVHHQALTWYDSERSARRAETRAIRQESPRFNIAGAIRPVRARVMIRTRLWRLAQMVGVGAFVTLTDLRAGFPSLQAALAPLADAVAFVTLATFLVALLVTVAPHLTRFGAWVERNSADRPRRIA